MTPESKKLGLNYQGTTLAEQRPADMTGEGGSLWRINLVDPAIVGMWLLHAPNAHPFWEYYCVSLIHLRDFEGGQPAQKDNPDMEYQITVMALNPERQLPLMKKLETGGTPERPIAFLQPVDFQSQFKAVGGDDVAYGIGDELCQLVVINKLSPDSDYRVVWSMHLTNKVVHALEVNSKRRVQ